MHLANFSRNSLNTNKVELGDSDFDTRLVKSRVRLGAKFINKMIEHIEDNLVPKETPNFAKSLFVEQTAGGIITLGETNTNANKQKGAAVSGAVISGTAVSGESNKRKSNGNEPGKKKSRKEFSVKSLKMGLFHTKKETPATKALSEKGKLKDEICLDLCTHEKKCNYPHQLCIHGKHYTNWKNIPEEDKPALLSHMSEMRFMRLDAETFEKHKQMQTIPSEFAHLLGDATGPKPKGGATKST